MDLASFPRDDLLPPDLSSKVQSYTAGAARLQFDPIFSTASMELRGPRVKFMCSHNGEILPRPSDKKLRYVGGETRMLSVPRHIRHADLLRKLMEIYGHDLALKYQLPDEDLDALVSVSSDEDLENMMEECDRLASIEGSSRLRVFIIPSSERDVANVNDVGDNKLLELRYVDAINAVSLRKQDDIRPASERLDPYAWNSAELQDRRSIVPENPQSDVLSMGKSVPTGNPLSLKTGGSEDDAAPNSPPLAPPLSTFTGQFAPFKSPSSEFALDQLVNMSGSHGAPLGVEHFRDLEYGGSASSSASTESWWPPNSSMHATKEFTLYGNGEDQAYRVEQRPLVEHKGASDGQMHVTASKGRLSSKEPPELQEGPMVLTSAGDYKAADDHLYGALPSSDSALLQQNQFQADWHPVQTHLMDSMQQPRLNSGLTQQKAFQHEPQQWQRLPFYNPSAALGHQEPGVLEHTENFPETSFLAQMLAPGEIHPVPQASVFQTSSVASSPPKGHLEVAGKPAQEVEIHEPFSASFPDQEYQRAFYDHEGGQSSWLATHPVSQEPSTLGQTEGAVKPGIFQPQTQMHQVSSAAFSVEDYARTLYNYDGMQTSEASCLAPPQASWTFLNAENNVQELLPRLNHLQSELVEATDRYSEGQSILAPLSVANGQQLGSLALKKHEETNITLPKLEKLHPSGLSLLEDSLPPASCNTYVTAQSENESFCTLGHTPSHLKGASPPSVLAGDVGRVVPLESLRSIYMPPETSLAGISTSGSLGTPVMPHQGVKGVPGTVGLESTIATRSGVELLQKNSEDSSFALDKDFTPLKEQFAQIRHEENTDTYLDTREQGRDLNVEETLDKRGEIVPAEVAAFCSAIFPVPTLPVATWETSLSEVENVQQAGMQEVEQDAEETSLSLAMEKELTVEDFKVESEERDRFESLPDRSSNAAVIAEAEAIAHGLQTIRNFDLEELRELGSGTFGTVYHGKWRGTDVAIKRIKSSCFTGRQSERERLIADFWREAYLLGQLHHPNVVAFYGVVPDGPGGTLATVTEYMVNGSLKQVLQKKDRTLDRRKRLLIAMDAAFGMEYLHGKNVVHFDIKCENLLVNLRDTQRPICKVGDLGLSKVKQQTMVSGGVRGTLPWMAPELLNGSSSLVSEKVDVFSFGIVLWELLTGEEPYANMHYGAIIGGIVNNTLRPPIPKWCDPQWRSLMERCWSADPAERPTFTEIAGNLRAMEATLNTRGQGQAPTAGS